MANILLVGIATIDIVYTLNHYPHEDDEVRAENLRVCRGGNAANTAVVLSRLGHQCTFVGVLAEAPETAVIEQDFEAHGVIFSVSPHCSGRPPTSSIYLSDGHRTIVHYRDLPELSFQAFAAIDLSAFDWVHFEGRNVPEVHKMLRRVRDLRPELPVSLEIEKPREGIEGLLEMPSVIIFSRAYAQAKGFNEPFAFLQGVAADTDKVLGWGEGGAYAMERGGAQHYSPASPPVQLIDTLGAGDAFNAGYIDARLRGNAMADVLDNACWIAGRKCGVIGFDI